MSIERAREYLRSRGIEERLKVLEDSSATVELAARALGCEPAHIAKTISLFLEDGAVLVVTAGDAKIDNKKFKEQFHIKPRMIPGDQVEGIIGHAPGGVCPFGANENVPVYLDISLKRFDIVYPAAGDAHSAVELTPAELEQYSGSRGWVDVCKGWDLSPSLMGTSLQCLWEGSS